MTVGMETLDLLVKEDQLDLQALLDHRVLVVAQDLQENVVLMVEMDVPGPQAPLALLEQQAMMVEQEPLVKMVEMAKQVPQEEME